MNNKDHSTARERLLFEITLVYLVFEITLVYLDMQMHVTEIFGTASRHKVNNIDRTKSRNNNYSDRNVKTKI